MNETKKLFADAKALEDLRKQKETLERTMQGIASRARGEAVSQARQLVSGFQITPQELGIQLALSTQASVSPAQEFFPAQAGEAKKLSKPATPAGSAEPKKRGRPPRDPSMSKPVVAKKSKEDGVKKRKPAEVKYRMGENSWTGRGMMPTWLKAQLAQGSSLTDFLVKDSAGLDSSFEEKSSAPPFDWPTPSAPQPQAEAEQQPQSSQGYTRNPPF